MTDTNAGSEGARAGTRATKKVSRAARWADAVNRAQQAVEELEEMQQEFQEWFDNLPENFQASALGEKLEAVCDLDLHSATDVLYEAAGVDLPRGFGRD